MLERIQKGFIILHTYFELLFFYFSSDLVLSNSICTSLCKVLLTFFPKYIVLMTSDIEQMEEG